MNEPAQTSGFAVGGDRSSSGLTSVSLYVSAETSLLGSHQVSEGGDRICGGFTAADGAFHVAVPLWRAFGAGPVDAPDRCAPRLAVGRPDSRCEVRAVS